MGTDAGSAQYLERRVSGIYFVRLFVPVRLKATVVKGEIHRTTCCRDYRLAKIVVAGTAACHMLHRSQTPRLLRRPTVQRALQQDDLD